MTDDIKREYIKTILSLQEEDNKSVLLYVAFDLSLVSLTLSQKLFQSPSSKSPFVVAALCLLLVSAALFFNYYRKMHLSRLKVADALLTLDTSAARQIPAEVWGLNRSSYRVGYAARLAGLAILVASYLALS